MLSYLHLDVADLARPNLIFHFFKMQEKRMAARSATLAGTAVVLSEPQSGDVFMGPEGHRLRRSYRKSDDSAEER
jgi:hypothetical protein